MMQRVPTDLPTPGVTHITLTGTALPNVVYSKLGVTEVTGGTKSTRMT